MTRRQIPTPSDKRVQAPSPIHPAMYLIPFGDDDHSIGAFDGVVGTIAEGDIREVLGRFFHAFRIESLDLSASFLKGRDNIKRWGIAHIVSVGFEGQREDGDGLGVNVATHGIDDALSHGFLARVVNGDHRVDDAHR